MQYAHFMSHLDMFENWGETLKAANGGVRKPVKSQKPTNPNKIVWFF